mgnify:FL=1
MLDLDFLYIVSFLIYILFLVIFLFKKFSFRKIIFCTFFYFYIVFVLGVTFFPIPISWLKEISIYYTNTNNYIPFSSIFEIYLNNNLPFIVKFKQIIGNIILFIPMWFFYPFIFKYINHLKYTLFIWFFSSIFIEFSQFIISLFLWFSYKVTDIDDVILNTFGFMVWFLIYKLIKKYYY